MLEDSPFLALPESLDEALTAVSERPSARVMGGGTDLMQELSWRHYEPSGFVSLIDDDRGGCRRDSLLVT